MTVDAAAVQAWEPVRKAAETAVKAIPGVTSAMVALTGERAGGRGTIRRRRHRVHLLPQQAGPRPVPQGHAGAGHPRRRRHHRRRVRQGRRRQIDDRSQPGARLARSRPQGRRARCRYLWAIGAETAGDQGQARNARRHTPQADGRLRPEGDVDRLSDRGRNADDLARPDGDVGADADAARGRVGYARCHGRRHAARHRRRAAHDGAAGAVARRGDRLDAAGSCADRCAARHRHVQARQCAGARHCREHELFRVPGVRHAHRHFRPRRRAA